MEVFGTRAPCCHGETVVDSIVMEREKQQLQATCSKNGKHKQARALTESARIHGIISSYASVLAPDHMF